MGSGPGLGDPGVQGGGVVALVVRAVVVSLQQVCRSGLFGSIEGSKRLAGLGAGGDLNRAGNPRLHGKQTEERSLDLLRSRRHRHTCHMHTRPV